MAVIKIEAKKDTRCMQTICLIRGDRRTQILRFGVNRFDGGVDLSDLTWVIKTANAKGVEDVFEPEAVEIGENRITVDWLVDGGVTDADGMAKYELNGLDATEDGKGIVWKGGMGTMSLRADIGENFADIDMTNVDRLVLYVEGRLQHIIDLTDELQNAGETANAAATAANAGAARAEAAAIAANTGATAATEAASNASAAAEAANTAALPHAQLYGMRVRGETANASGNPVTFLPDAGSLLQPVTVLEPQQQGSGDPYPAGGGIKNKFTGWIRGENINPENGAFGANASGARTGYIAVSPSAYIMISGLTETLFFFAAYYDSNKNFIDRTGAIPVSSLSIQTPDNCAYIALTQYENPTVAGVISDLSNAIQIEYGTSITEYEEWENIRPFIGCDKLGLNHAGKNLCNISPFLSAWATENAAMLSLLNTLAPGTYTVSVVFEMQNPERASATDKCGLFFYPYAERVFVEWGSVAVGTTRRVTCTFNVTADNAGKFTAAYFYGCGADGIGYTGYATAKDVQLEINTTATTYEPYQGKLHTVQIGQTVYGFRYEWLTGKGVIEWAMSTFDGSEDEGWSLYEYDQDKASVFNYNVDALPGIVDTGNLLIPGFCSWTASAEGSLVDIFRASANSTRMEIPHETLVKWGVAANFDAFKAKLAANPMQIAYKLATPVEIQLTPHIISAADPEQTNTLYGDGRIDVEYVKPLHVSIEERVAAAVAAAMNTEGE